MGLDALKILVLSQVVLSFTLPFALIPLIVLTRRANVMGDLTNSRARICWRISLLLVILLLNGLLLYQAFGGNF